MCAYIDISYKQISLKYNPVVDEATLRFPLAAPAPQPQPR